MIGETTACFKSRGTCPFINDLDIISVMYVARSGEIFFINDNGIGSSGEGDLVESIRDIIF